MERTDEAMTLKIKPDVRDDPYSKNHTIPLVLFLEQQAPVVTAACSKISSSACSI